MPDKLDLMDSNPPIKTRVLDSFLVELHIASSLLEEVQRDTLLQLDDSRFWRRVAPDLARTLHDARLDAIKVVIKR
jgi:hypothetical protein